MVVISFMFILLVGLSGISLGPCDWIVGCATQLAKKSQFQQQMKLTGKMFYFLTGGCQVESLIFNPRTCQY